MKFLVAARKFVICNTDCGTDRCGIRLIPFKSIKPPCDRCGIKFL